MPGRTALDDLLKEKVSWAEKIAVSDSDYRDYAGASLEIGQQLAMIDIFLLILPKKSRLTIILKIRRKYLIQVKKATFAGQRADVISILGFLMSGVKKKGVKSTKPNWRDKF